MKSVSYSKALMLCLLFLGSSLLHVGCSPRQGSSTVTHGSIGWESVDAEPTVPGTDQAMVRWYTRDDRLTYVVWTDLTGGGGSNSGSSGESSSGLVHHLAQLESSDDVHFEYEYSLDTNNKDSSITGKVTINGVDYHLDDGALVLVSTQEHRVKVKQLEFDPTIINLLRDKTQSPESLREALKSMANDRSDVRGFFESAMTGE